MTKTLLYCLAITSLLSCSQSSIELKKKQLNSPTDALLQAVSIVDANVAWVSGHDATILRTLDGGNTWEKFIYEGADTLQFRDIHAFSAKKAVVMSAGPGKASQIFRFDTRVGFTKTYQMQDSVGFLNTIEFWKGVDDSSYGLAFGDSFNGKLFVLKTADAGSTWSRIDPKKLPVAGEGEGGFAASGTCIATQPGGKAWIGTGAGGNSRVLYTEDYGKTWTTYSVPLVKGKSAGIFSIRMLTDEIGAIVGGDLGAPDQYMDNIAFTADGGKTWTLAGPPKTTGTFYGSDFTYLVEGDLVTENTLWIATGPSGIDYSLDRGLSFANLDTAEYWAVDLHELGFGYAAGRGGKVLKINY